MHKLQPVIIAALISAALLSKAFAQDATTSDLPALKRDLQKCSVIKRVDARSKCYKAVAERAVGEMERDPVKPAKADDEMKADAEQKAQKNKTESEALARKRTEKKYQLFVTEARAVLLMNFHNPGSADWRDVFISADKEWMLCGEVNSKDKYGVYVGYRRFLTTERISPFTVIEGKDNKAEFDVMWSSRCTKPIYRSAL